MTNTYKSNDPFSTDYQEPQTTSQGNYTRLEQGANNILILSNAIAGYEFWTDTTDKEGKAKRQANRCRFEELVEGEKAKIFYSMVVYNFNTKKIEIFTTTVRDIKDGLVAIKKNEDLKDPQDYKITITKTQTNPNDPMTTSYRLQHTKEMQPTITIASQFESLELDLELLYSDKDPFEGKSNPVVE
jgi:hypothetical protein